VYDHSISAADFAELKTLSDQVLDKLTGKAQTDEMVRKSIRSYRQFLLLNDSRHAHAMDIQSEIRDSLMAENVLAEMEPGRWCCWRTMGIYNEHRTSFPKVPVRFWRGN
jgi:erythromycin esterase